MAIQNNVTVKGALISNAYIKIQRLNVNASVRPAKAATTTSPAVVAGTNWNGNVVVGIFATKILADANPTNAIESKVIAVKDALTLPGSSNIVAAVYTYLLTLPEFAGATAV